MSYTSFVKTIFDPKIYSFIISNILEKTNKTEIDLVVIILLNSIYFNEYLDMDLVWADLSQEEQTDYINGRITDLINIGVELINNTSHLIKDTYKSIDYNKDSVQKDDEKIHSGRDSLRGGSNTNSINSSKPYSMFDYVDNIEDNANDQINISRKKLDESLNDKTARKTVSFNDEMEAEKLNNGMKEALNENSI